MQQHSRIYSIFEAGGCSDNLRRRIQFKEGERRKRKTFKFTNAITKMHEFIPLLETQWSHYAPLFHSTSAMFRLTKNLKGLNQPLRLLSKEKLGTLYKRTKESYLSLCEKQKQTMLNPTPEAMKEKGLAYEKWKKLADLEEDLNKQRSKLHWL